MKPTGPIAMAATVLVVGITAVAAIAFPRYSGAGLVFLLFTVSFIPLAVLIFPQPRLYAYTFLAALLGLGLWAKVMVHIIWPLPFVEPVGNFANTAGEWDSALLAMSCAALGIVAARCLHLWYRRTTRGAVESGGTAAPDWFVRWRRSIWLLTIVLVVGVNAANLHFAFFQIGINAKLLLPMRLHILVAWLVNVGFALWVAALLWWDCKAKRQTLGRNLIIPFVESFFSSVSALSRIAYLVHGGPYWLALFERRNDFSEVMKRRTLASLVGCFLLLFVGSVLTIFWLRSNYYPANADLRRNLALEIPQLIVQRWVGMEGVLAVGATSNRGIDLLVAAITDSPKLGGRSLYQRLAKTRYLVDETQTFTFLTSAGPVAVLLFSGSLVVVFFAMGLIAFVVIITEEFTRKLTGNPFLLAVSGAAIANVVSQTTFFYLTLVFFLQMWVAVLFLAAIERLRFGARTRP